MRKIRIPPRPHTWSCPKGTCRFCGEPIIENGIQNKRKNWHVGCIEIWNIMSIPKIAREHVWHREKGVCQGCGKDSWSYGDSWEVDHHKPLWEAIDLSSWHPDNLRLLCHLCHKTKTKQEASRRALNKKTKNTDNKIE
jgi:hypothetical protein